jgi:hypothetical protein
VNSTLDLAPESASVNGRAAAREQNRDMCCFEQKLNAHTVHLFSGTKLVRQEGEEFIMSKDQKKAANSSEQSLGIHALPTSSARPISSDTI